MKKLKFGKPLRPSNLRTEPFRSQHAEALFSNRPMAVKNALKLLTAFINLESYPPDFFDYVKAHPPTPDEVYAVLNIALASRHPDQPYRSAMIKARLYTHAKEQVQAAWNAYHGSPKDHGKEHFIRLVAGTIKDANGHPVAASTIKSWLPKKNMTIC